MEDKSCQACVNWESEWLPTVHWDAGFSPERLQIPLTLEERIRARNATRGLRRKTSTGTSAGRTRESKRQAQRRARPTCAGVSAGERRRPGANSADQAQEISGRECRRG